MLLDFLKSDWGNLVGVLGVIVSFVGLWWAIAAARGAQKSAEAAKDAALETQDSIKRVMAVADLHRAISLIQRLKSLHREERWEIALEHYQELRHLLSDIAVRYPNVPSELEEVIREAIGQIRAIEDNVDSALRNESTPTGANNFNRRLNNVQVQLERAASSAPFSDAQGVSDNG